MTRQRDAERGRQAAQDASLRATARPTHGLLALQRAAGNRAVSALVQRKAIFDKAGTLVRMRYTVGTEFDATFAQVAKGVVTRGPFRTSDIFWLQSTATGGASETFNDDQRTFTAALLDPGNAALLRRTPFAGNGDQIEFVAASITAAHRAAVADRGRTAPSKAVTGEGKAMSAAAKKGDYLGVAKHLKTMEANAEQEYLTLFQGSSYLSAAKATLGLAHGSGVLISNLLAATLAAASDSTEGDRAMAGAAYTVAVLIGSAVAADLLSGRVLVDEVPHSAMKPDEWAAYQAAGNKDKGDTIYLPDDLDPADLAHRAAIVHELSHVADDKARAGPKVVTDFRDAGELRAYRAQARFLLDQIGGLSGSARTTAISQTAKLWNVVIAWVMAIEVRADPARGESILLAIEAAATGSRLGPARRQWVKAAPAADLPKIETALLAEIRQDYQIVTAQQNLVIQDGLGGQSLLDWVTRPM